jgi:hypothetical protein|tara:strand:- start:219 stop:449 length:231 start_codon:yes stop_codon:yes gene_type:complete
LNIYERYILKRRKKEAEFRRRLVVLASILLALGFILEKKGWLDFSRQDNLYKRPGEGGRFITEKEAADLDQWETWQ